MEWFVGVSIIAVMAMSLTFLAWGAWQLAQLVHVLEQMQHTVQGLLPQRERLVVNQEQEEEKPPVP